MKNPLNSMSKIDLSDHVGVVCMVAALVGGVAWPGSTNGATLSHDTLIGFADTNYDGQEIVVTNCTVTSDGVHTFANMQLLQGAILTHTFAPGGVLENRLHITGEQHVLSDTNPATLNQTNVDASTIVVNDLSGVTNYVKNIDYALGFDAQFVLLLR